MSRAKDRANEIYRGDTPITILRRKDYCDGYRQAEKDLELTWEDVKEICVQSVLVEVDLGGLVSDERHYKEVLKRFKEAKEEIGYDKGRV